MNKQELRTGIQHGEVLMVPVDKLPKGNTRKATNQIIAHSETGHHHVVESGVDFEIMGDLDKHNLYLRLFEPAKLVHKKATDKHRTLTVPAGDWKILHKTEYDPWSKVINVVKD